MLVPPPAAPALADGQLLAGLGQVAQQVGRPGLIELKDHRARRHRDHQVLPPVPRHLRGAAVLAVLGRELLVRAEGTQRIERRPHLEDHIAALAAVAAIRAAMRHKLLPAEMHHAIAAFARPYVNIYLVYKHGLHSVSPSQPPPHLLPFRHK